MYFIAYYRVSTDRQGKSGLGLDAQRAAVATHVQGRGEIIAEYTETESGSRADRPELLNALNQCRRKRARLIIAKLDRLSRNSAFINNLLESGVDFIAADMPEATPFVLRIMAAVAQQEREAISKRTKEALAEAKARGTRLGNPRPAEAAKRAREVYAANTAARRATVRPTALELRAQGMSLPAIARELNRRSVPTPRGRQWAPASVANLLAASDSDQQQPRNRDQEASR
jgi:DNA invertase Pin-like site-specific DNA recombinase